MTDARPVPSDARLIPRINIIDAHHRHRLFDPVERLADVGKECLPFRSQRQPGRFTQKQWLAEQFLKDDEARGFSKKKYEQVNERSRRMGEKRRNYKLNKAKFRRNNKFKDGKKGSKK